MCRVLEIEQVSSAVRILDPDERATHDTLQDRNFKGAKINDLGVGGGNNTVTIISEPGLYKLVARSRKPEAKRAVSFVLDTTPAPGAPSVPEPQKLRC